jgi:hypothetical protein
MNGSDFMRERESPWEKRKRVTDAVAQHVW